MTRAIGVVNIEEDRRRLRVDGAADCRFRLTADGRRIDIEGREQCRYRNRDLECL